MGNYQTKEEWIELAKAEIQNRIYKYSEKEIRFNLLVVCEELKGLVNLMLFIRVKERLMD